LEAAEKEGGEYTGEQVREFLQQIEAAERQMDRAPRTKSA
jgi:hypothetical protein